MLEHPSSRFSASPALIGYIYQCQFALSESIERLLNGDNFVVSLETIDDVVFETEGRSLDILQTKHHLRKATSLSDASVDIWKSLRVWLEGKEKGDIPLSARLCLITTESAPKESAAHYLKPETRNTKTAVDRLTGTASSSANELLKDVYVKFNSLTATQKETLLESVTILDASLDISDLDAKLKRQVFIAAPRNHVDSFLEYLVGWWFRRVIKALTQPELRLISSDEIYYEMTDLKEKYQEDNLPIDADILHATVDEAPYQDYVFVHQLDLINVGKKRIFYAISDYYKAYEQCSQWLKNGLIFPTDLETYESRLVEEWDRRFQRMVDRLGESAAEAQKLDEANKIYDWIDEADNHRRIKNGVTEPYVARGSYQLLSDKMKIGWHPDFTMRLKQLLEKEGA